MNSEIIVALITAAGLIVVQLIISIKQNRLAEAKMDAKMELIMHRIGQLEAKQDKHNSLIERMVVVEQSSKSAHHRIDEIREEMEHA